MLNIELKEDIERRIKIIISELLNIDLKNINDNSSFLSDLGVDSLGIIELVISLEEEFNIEIPDEEIEKMNNIQSIIDYIVLIKKKSISF